MKQRKTTVFIYLPGEPKAVPAGIFTHDSDAGIGTFAYGKRYIERRNALPVDPVALPLEIQPREADKNGGLYGAFRDAAPDYWGRLVIASEAGVAPESLTEFDFLMAGNATRVGNLDFRPSPDSPEPELKPPHFNKIRDIIEASQKIEKGETVDHALLQILLQGTSMGGARPKCTIELDGALWIAKFPSCHDSFNMPTLEYATMSLASSCGIQIPEIKLVKAEGRDIFLIRRFDREHHPHGWTRSGFISALSLMQWDESDRLLWAYPSIADTMRRYCHVNDIRELFRRMVFNILVRNTDDHPRNHGFICSGNRLALSSAYDIVPAPTRAGVGSEFSLAMSVGQAGRQATLKNALSRPERFGLSPDEAESIVNELSKKVSQWQSHYHTCGVSEKDMALISASFMCVGTL